MGRFVINKGQSIATAPWGMLGKYFPPQPLAFTSMVNTSWYYKSSLPYNNTDLMLSNFDVAPKLTTLYGVQYKSGASFSYDEVRVAMQSVNQQDIILWFDVLFAGGKERKTIKVGKYNNRQRFYLEFNLLDLGSKYQLGISENGGTMRFTGVPKTNTATAWYRYRMPPRYWEDIQNGAPQTIYVDINEVESTQSISSI